MRSLVRGQRKMLSGWTSVAVIACLSVGIIAGVRWHRPGFPRSQSLQDLCWYLLEVCGSSCEKGSSCGLDGSGAASPVWPYAPGF